MMVDRQQTALCAEPAGIADIRDFCTRRQGLADKRKKSIRTADERFAGLDEESQRYVLSYVIGFMEALSDNILSGKKVHQNEVSHIFEVMERVTDKKWKERRGQDG